jgi:NAD(P)-dependent dehydrogenase (short-subunit alcohol dehydrogenase family)
MAFDITQLFDISGKVALVTGGTRGIGRMLAEGFLRNGVKTYITGRDEAASVKAAAELSEIGEAVGLFADLAGMTGVRRLAREIAEREPKLHILMNNAGTFSQAALEDYSEQQFDETMSLNAKAPFFLTQALLPQLEAAATRADPARVINMASGAGQFVGASNMFSYGASKAALIHLTMSLAAALAERNITVNAVTPGTVVTEVSREYTAQFGEVLFASIPTRRFTTPEEIAGTVIYLCGAAGANTTGQVVCADGGQTVMPVVRD